jgi:hypothetical protein
MTCSNVLLLKLTKWCNARSFALVFVLSICHIGVANMHTRDSGRADIFSPALLNYFVS